MELSCDGIEASVQELQEWADVQADIVFPEHFSVSNIQAEHKKICDNIAVVREAAVKNEGDIIEVAYNLCVEAADDEAKFETLKTHDIKESAAVLRSALAGTTMEGKVDFNVGPSGLPTDIAPLCESVPSVLVHSFCF